MANQAASAFDIETILKVARDLKTAVSITKQEFAFGSIAFVPHQFRSAPRPPPTPFAGVSMVINPHLPRYAAMLKETRSGELPRYTWFDLRRRPHTGDMGQMVDDLRRHGAIR